MPRSCDEVLLGGVLALGIRTGHRRVRCCLWVAIRTNTGAAHRRTRNGVRLPILLLLLRLLLLLLLLSLCHLRVC